MWLTDKEKERYTAVLRDMLFSTCVKNKINRVQLAKKYDIDPRNLQRFDKNKMEKNRFLNSLDFLKMLATMNELSLSKFLRSITKVSTEKSGELEIFVSFFKNFIKNNRKDLTVFLSKNGIEKFLKILEVFLKKLVSCPQTELDVFIKKISETSDIAP